MQNFMVSAFSIISANSISVFFVIVFHPYRLVERDKLRSNYYAQKLALVLHDVIAGYVAEFLAPSDDVLI